MKNQTSTDRYCAFLRGVNVKGTNMKMTDVCSVFEKAGMEQVSSVLASGNILFSSYSSKNDLKAQLEKAMSAHFNYDAFLFVLDQQEIEVLYNSSPFNAHADFHIYGFVGIPGIDSILQYEYEKSSKTTGEEGKIVANNFYWRVPKGDTLGSEFGKILGRKNLKDAFTSRNLNTFERILKKL